MPRPTCVPHAGTTKARSGHEYRGTYMLAKQIVPRERGTVVIALSDNNCSSILLKVTLPIPLKTLAHIIVQVSPGHKGQNKRKTMHRRAKADVPRTLFLEPQFAREKQNALLVRRNSHSVNTEAHAPEAFPHWLQAANINPRSCSLFSARAINTGRVL